MTLAVGAVLVPLAAAAHLEFASGRLLDLAARADSVVLARVVRLEPTQGSLRRIVVDDVRDAAGAQQLDSLQAPQRMALEIGATYLFFVDAARPQARVLQPEGTVLRIGADGAASLAAVERLRAALRLDDGAIAAALIDLLSAAEEELRWHAALALLDWRHPGHSLAPAERQRLQSLLSSENFDPGLRTLLQPLTAAAPATPETH